MRQLYVVLVDHCVAQRGVYPYMTQQSLHLLDRHPFVDGHRREGSSELVRMHTLHMGRPPQRFQPPLHTANLQTLMRIVETDKQSRIVVCPFPQICLQMYLRTGVEVDNSLLVPLAEHHTLTFLEVEVGTVDSHQLPDADARTGQ